MPTASALQDRALLDAARSGDEGAFTRLLEGHRRELHAHCYRMLGSYHDAEDAMQDVGLRAWRGLPRFDGRSSLRSWLYRIATNVCLDAINRRARRVLPIDHGPSAGAGADPAEPLVETVWVEPYPDERLGLEDGYASPEATYEQRESVELAFIAAMQRLPASQRATLILREVLGFSAAEVADTLETSTASVNSSLQRARKAVADDLPERTQQATLRALGDETLREIVQRYVEAWDSGDPDAVVAMLAEDAAFSMPPNATWFRGREAILEFLPRGPLSIPRRFVPLRANGQPAFATYRWVADEARWLGNAIHVITLRDDGGIVDAVAFLSLDLFPAFGVPPVLDAPPPA